MDSISTLLHQPIWSHPAVPVIPESRFIDYTQLLQLQEPCPETMPKLEQQLWDATAQALDRYFYPELTEYQTLPNHSSLREFIETWLTQSVLDNFQELMDLVGSGRYLPGNTDHPSYTCCGGKVMRYFEFYQFCTFYSDAADTVFQTEDPYNPIRQQLYLELYQVAHRYRIGQKVPKFNAASRHKPATAV